MLFSSVVFLYYFLPIFLLLYFVAGKPYRNYVILAGSIFFYSWGEPFFIFVILAVTGIDFLLVGIMNKAESRFKRRLLVTISVCTNMGLLFYFKYCNFFIDNINSFTTAAGIGKIPHLNVIMPLGISFYTFETITYVVDVYRKVHKPLQSFGDYLLYIILFPKLIAGPIIRYHQLADQIHDRPDNLDDKLVGFYQFSVGLAKKVIIANAVGQYADQFMNWDGDQINSTQAWTGLICYTFQIYFDFAGYSDMAIGLGRMMGFRFPENFNSPYTSFSITEFWRRWHITLGAWMKNYLYIPLGGNRVAVGRNYINLWIVFLASGFWHGASWNFIIWGAIHGSMLVVERAFLLRVYGWAQKYTAFRPLPWLITFLLVMMAWIFFKADTPVQAFHYLSALWALKFEVIYFPPDLIFAILIAAAFAFITFSKPGKLWMEHFYHKSFNRSKHFVYAIISVLLLVLATGHIISSDFNPFIYFRF